jgi:cystathionine beta-lyase/cystathionine gamma-synthase
VVVSSLTKLFSGLANVLGGAYVAQNHHLWLLSYMDAE